MDNILLNGSGSFSGPLIPESQGFQESHASNMLMKNTWWQAFR
jgi:hypothetical protein